MINTSQVPDLPLPSRNVTLNSEFSVDGVSIVSGSTGGVQRVPSTEGQDRILTA